MEDTMNEGDEGDSEWKSGWFTDVCQGIVLTRIAIRMRIFVLVQSSALNILVLEYRISTVYVPYLSEQKPGCLFPINGFWPGV